MQLAYRLGQATTAAVSADYFIELAVAAEIRGDWDGYGRAIENALKINPNNPSALYSRGLHRLRLGMPGGWGDYEYRKPRLDLCEDLDEWPEWDGGSLEGKHILIAGEQGLGDQIMFSRYIPSVMRQRPRRATLHVRPELARLFATFASDWPALSIVTDDRDIESNDLDCWIGMGSLPLHFGFAEPFLAMIAKPPVVVPDTDRLNVGLCWAGNPEHKRDAHRSITFPDLGPILNSPSCNFYAFQFGPAAAQNDGSAIDVTKYCHDFADTAALLDEMDVLVSVDTAMVHLAGSVATPVLLLQPTGYLDWRWGSGKWYSDVKVCGIKEAAERLCEMGEAARYEPGIRSAQATDVALVSRDVSTTETRYGQMKYFARDKYLGRSLELYGEWSEGEVDLFRAFIKPGDVVVEAGANIGAHTKALMDIVGPTGRIYAFEPNMATGRLLGCNVFEHVLLDQQRFVHYGVALSDRHAVYETAFDAGNPGGCQYRYHGEQLDMEDGYWDGMRNPNEANSMPLDTLLPQLIHHGGLNFLKADVEGMELDVLRGAEKTIERCRPFIYVENDRPQNTETLCSWLHERRYRLYMHCPRLYNPNNFKGNKINVFGNLISSMILAIPREKYIAFDMNTLGLARIRVSKT
jgi:FkbM family methyltransferase